MRITLILAGLDEFKRGSLVKEKNGLAEAWIFGVLVIGLSFFVFWGPLAFFRIAAISFVSSTRGPLWAIILYLLGGFVPSLTALALTGIREGKGGVKALLKHALEFRIGIKWYFIIVGIALSGALGQLAVNEVLGNEFPFGLYVQQLPSFFFLLIAGPLSEEFGWRGYFLKRLKARHGDLTSSLIAGCVWALWHLPLFLMPGTSQHELKLPYFGFFAGIIAQSVIMTWLDSNTGSSLVAAIFYHWLFTFTAQVNSTGVIRSAAYNWLEYLPYIFMALVIAAVYKGNRFAKAAIMKPAD